MHTGSRTSKLKNKKKYKKNLLHPTSCPVSQQELADIHTIVHSSDRLGVLVVKASASRADDPGFESRLRRDFFGVESYQ